MDQGRRNIIVGCVYWALEHTDNLRIGARSHVREGKATLLHAIWSSVTEDIPGFGKSSETELQSVVIGTEGRHSS